MKMKFVIYLQFVIVVCGCQSNLDERGLFFLLHEQYEIPITRNEQYFLFIPETGCEGCVRYATALDRLNHYKSNVSVIYLYNEVAKPIKFGRRSYAGSLIDAYENGLFAFNIVLYKSINARIEKVCDIDANNIEDVMKIVTNKEIPREPVSDDLPVYRSLLDLSSAHTTRYPQ